VRLDLRKRIAAISLRTKIVAWLIPLHLVFVAMGVYVAMQNHLLLFAVELCFVLSIMISIRLVRAFFVPLDLIRTGAELMAEHEFTSRFVRIGQPELDQLIDVYNAMIDRLREERLAAEEHHQLLQSVVQASPSGVVICDFEGGVQQVNPAAAELVRDPGIIEALPAIAAGESRIVPVNGSRRVKVSRAEFRDRGFAKSFYLFDEMTDALRLNEKAAYEKLIRMMSHEVNNSVAAIRSLLESLMRYAPQIGGDDREDFANALQIASARIESLNRFMSGFADVVRIPPPHIHDCDLGELLRDVVTLLRPELEQRAIALRLDVSGSTSVRIDSNQFEQVIINIIRNAAESIEQSGTVDVIWRNFVLSVIDSGAGISESTREELFTPFFTTKPHGRGLGLTIVQEILASQHVAFSLQNRSDRPGAEFRIIFPEHARTT
jgi:nitrogen fixation/metabolism regulation signal transduction histidine kinase